MKLEVDTEAKTLTVTADGKEKSLPLYSVEAFKAVSDIWVKVGWEMKYGYTFTWMGRPFIQLPEDVLRLQEVIFQLKPDYILETGIAHGGSLIFHASLFEAMGHGQVIGVDIEIRPHNRKAIEEHPLFKRIKLIEGSSTAPEIVQAVRDLIPAGSKVLVILDSDHSKGHVADELECYHDLVGVGSYIVATDGIMESLADVPRGQPGWIDDNPASAAREFAARHPEFRLANPPWLFNESELGDNVTHWPDAWLQRVK